MGIHAEDRGRVIRVVRVESAMEQGLDQGLAVWPMEQRHDVLAADVLIVDSHFRRPPS